jgi:hypothetical protein
VSNSDTQPTPSPTPAPAPRTAEQIQSDIESAQKQLAATVDELSERLSPQALAEDATGVVKGWFVHSDGSVKVKPIAIIGGTLAGLIVLRQLFHD